MTDFDAVAKTVAIMVVGGGFVWLRCALTGREFDVKISALMLIPIGLVFYGMQTRSTTFAADGTDGGWDAAVRRSQASGEPTVVLFTADWCPSCQALHAHVLSRGDVQDELQNHYNFYTVDLSHPSPKVQAHARKLGVSGIPCLIRYDTSQRETARTHGMSPEQIIAWLKAGE